MVNNERETFALHIKGIPFSLNRMDGYFSTLHSLLLSLFLCIKFLWNNSLRSAFRSIGIRASISTCFCSTSGIRGESIQYLKKKKNTIFFVCLCSSIVVLFTTVYIHPSQNIPIHPLHRVSVFPLHRVFVDEWKSCHLVENHPQRTRHPLCLHQFKI